MSANLLIKKLFRLFGCEIRLIRNVRRAHELEKKGVWQSKWQILADLMDVGSIIDVGANTGQFAVMVSHVFPEAVIYSFEPLPVCFEQLKANTAEIESCSVYRLAMGSSVETRRFNQSEYSPCSSFLEATDLLTSQIPETEHVHPVEVQVETLDRFFQNISLEKKILLKLDVQGFEGEVIRGARSFLERVDVIVSEVAFDTQYVNQPLFDDIYMLLKEYGFSYHGNIDQNISRLDSRVIEADAIFLKN